MPIEAPFRAPYSLSLHENPFVVFSVISFNLFDCAYIVSQQHNSITLFYLTFIYVLWNIKRGGETILDYSCTVDNVVKRKNNIPHLGLRRTSAKEA